MVDAPSQKEVEEFKTALIKMTPNRIEELLEKGKIAREWKRDMAREIVRRMRELEDSTPTIVKTGKGRRVKVWLLSWLFTGTIIAIGFWAAYNFVFSH